MDFAYLRDPLFLVCFAAYWVNRALYYTFEINIPFLHCYLNDIICLPFWVPIMLWACRVLGLRPDDAPPRGFELAIPLVMWAVVFEVVLPVTPAWRGLAIADPNDVLCYAAGGCAASLYWNQRYQPQEIAELA